MKQAKRVEIELRSKNTSNRMGENLKQNPEHPYNMRLLLHENHSNITACFWILFHQSQKEVLQMNYESVNMDWDYWSTSLVGNLEPHDLKEDESNAESNH